jgi:SAM-dependent MidA family methyltransferase
LELGHPKLVDKLVARIKREGPLSFADFMEAALYDPDFGYYMTPGPRIGREGDYYTSLDVHPIFAKSLGRQIAQAADLIVSSLKERGDFTIIEMGAGKGLLARHLLNAYRRDNPAFLSRVRYVLIERSPAMIAAQRQHLRPLLDGGAHIRWAPDLSMFPPGSVTGVILSNELVDAFPVHRVVMRPLGLREIFVGWDEVGVGGVPLAGPPSTQNGRFIEIEAPPASSALERHLKRLGVALEIGQRADVNLQALEWMRQVGAILRRGLVLTIDYGHTAADLYASSRKTGTLLCYHHHTVSDSPYRRVGQQDITAHVDFTSLALTGQEAGLTVTGFTNQLHFLMGLGIESAFAGVDPESSESAAMRALLRPDGMGTTYKVLIQHKDMPAPELDGLRSRPFFPDALLADRKDGRTMEATAP